MKRLIIALLVSFMFSFSYAKENTSSSHDLSITMEKSLKEFRINDTKISPKPEFHVRVYKRCVTFYWPDGPVTDCEWVIEITL